MLFKENIDFSPRQVSTGGHKKDRQPPRSAILLHTKPVLKKQAHYHDPENIFEAKVQLAEVGQIHKQLPIIRASCQHFAQPVPLNLFVP